MNEQCLPKPANKSFTASAPGSLMVMGEYAVLHGHPALVSALDLRLKVEIIPNESQSLKISCPVLGEDEQKLSDIKITAPFKFVWSCLDMFKNHLVSGCVINISSMIEPGVGLGSSAAVTVAMIGALSNWLGLNLSKRQVFDGALNVIRQIQGAGSGADAAASTFGGMLYYKNDPFSYQCLPLLPIAVVYAGYKTPTGAAIEAMQKTQENNPNYLQRIYQEIGNCVEDAKLALLSGDAAVFYEGVKKNQQLMAELGVSDQTMGAILGTMAQDLADDIMAAKISGSGLGDCVIGFLHNKNIDAPQVRLSQAISSLNDKLKTTPKNKIRLISANMNSDGLIF